MKFLTRLARLIKTYSIYYLSQKRINILNLKVFGKFIHWGGKGRVVIRHTCKLGSHLHFVVNGFLDIQNGVLLDDYFRIQDEGVESNVKIGPYSSLGVFSRICIWGAKGVLDIGKNVHFRGNLNIVVDDGGVLQIGKNSFFNNYCSINCQSEITIGEHCFFGEDVKIYDHNHKYGVEHEGFITNSFNKAKIEIGENCWIGSNVTILKGVTIGDNVVIGANCLIYKSVPSNSVVKLDAKLKIDIAN